MIGDKLTINTAAVPLSIEEKVLIDPGTDAHSKKVGRGELFYNSLIWVGVISGIIFRKNGEKKPSNQYLRTSNLINFCPTN